MCEEVNLLGLEYSNIFGPCVLDGGIKTALIFTLIPLRENPQIAAFIFFSICSLKLLIQRV